MITLLHEGTYRLIETNKRVKILYLDGHAFAWVYGLHIGEMLVVSRRQHKTDYVLSIGKYKLYDVEDEPALVDQQHLELEVGKHKWQGYLLFTGLPSLVKKRGRIMPTTERITGNLLFSRYITLAEPAALADQA